MEEFLVAEPGRRGGRSPAQGTQPPVYFPTSQGREVSSRGQRPRKRRPLTPFPLSPPAGRGAPKAACGAWSGGCTPGYSTCSPAGSTRWPRGPRTRGSTGFKRVVNSHHWKHLQKALKQLLGIRTLGTGNGRLSGELVERDGADWWGSGGEQGLNPAHGFWRQQNVPANVARLGRNVFDHHHVAPPLHGVDDRPWCFIRARASCNRACHGQFPFSEAFPSSAGVVRKP